MTLMQGVRLYPKAIAWSILISSCIIMEGYDVSRDLHTDEPILTWSTGVSRRKLLYVKCAKLHRPVLTNSDANDAFNRKYGELTAAGTYEVPARWQAGLSNGVQCGEIIGLFINGWISEKIGYRYTVMASLAFLTGVIAIFFTAPNIQVLLVAEILAGIPWGVFQTL